jgi:hypothetical protein
VSSVSVYVSYFNLIQFLPFREWYVSEPVYPFFYVDNTCIYSMDANIFYCYILYYSDFLIDYMYLHIFNRINGVMVSVLASSAVDSGFDPRSCQTKDYEIGICCFFTKHTAFRRKRKDWLAQNHDNMSEWSDMSTRGMLFQ